MIHELAEAYGIRNLQTLVFFENQVPNFYKGNLTEEAVLEWLKELQASDEIETVSDQVVELVIDKCDYLAVLFCDLKNEESVLEWLIDDDNHELPDEIETVNLRMLNKLVEESPFLAVYFYKTDCHECERVLMELENIDDECDILGIDLVKIFDPEAAKQYNVENLPAVAFFSKQVAVFYDGDLYDEEALLKWLTSNDVFEIQDEIEEVNRKMLEKLLEDNEFVAVFFYENNCPKCDEVLQELKRIDDEADDLEIMFVKIKDPRYAKKYGIAQLPALVYFRKKFPSIYRRNLLEEEEVLEWLRKNRYRHPELNLFMYGLSSY
ncbi:uncharacterized protein LOC118183275 isoform X2 [Stegodyphus dumicola]|uniref:uncharacterized protein LOC118183275 isoform X2 n=1 Tax=Stegodyphus dumicola TaxID=202533 RepID=UPI0015A963E8|nr:uncharacterized protein LOC118183275 isoform X2 [Stegodyphus dumicola]